jgi:hypothetical protein
VTDPVSWLLIERGWEVVDADGQEVGKIEEAVGDSTHDIFNGLTIATACSPAGSTCPPSRSTRSRRAASG